MSKTKEKILQTALELFNKEGISNITLRNIATAMNISQGNLNYHYKKREDIVFALYKKVVHIFDETYTKMKQPEASLDLLFQSSAFIYKTFEEYKFLMLDFVEIMRQYPSIKEHHQRLHQIRKAETLQVFELMQQKGFMLAEEFSGQWECLVQQILIIGDFSMANLNIFHVEDNSNHLKTFVQLLTQLIYPYLTIIGKKAYWETYKKMTPQ